PVARADRGDALRPEDVQLRGLVRPRREPGADASRHLAQELHGRDPGRERPDQRPRPRVDHLGHRAPRPGPRLARGLPDPRTRPAPGAAAEAGAGAVRVAPPPLPHKGGRGLRKGLVHNELGKMTEPDRWEVPKRLGRRMTEAARDLRKRPTPSESILSAAIRE